MTASSLQTVSSEDEISTLLDDVHDVIAFFHDAATAVAYALGQYEGNGSKPTLDALVSTLEEHGASDVAQNVLRASGKLL